MTNEGCIGTPAGAQVDFGGYPPKTQLRGNSTRPITTSGAVPAGPSVGSGTPAPRWAVTFFYLDSGVSILSVGFGVAPTVGVYGLRARSHLDPNLWVFEFESSDIIPEVPKRVTENCLGVTRRTLEPAQGVGEGFTVNLGLMTGGETANGPAFSPTSGGRNSPPAPGVSEMNARGGMATGSPLTATTACWWFS